MCEPEQATNNWDRLGTSVGSIDEDFASAVAEKLEEQKRPALGLFE